MNVWDILIIVMVSAAFLGVAGWLVYRKVKHRGGCIGCDCGCGGKSCPHCKNDKK